MAQEEKVVDKIIEMHFPRSEIECQTSISWVKDEMIDLEDKLKQIEENIDLDPPEKSETNEDSYKNKKDELSFSYGVIVNETETNGFSSASEESDSTSTSKFGNSNQQSPLTPNQIGKLRGPRSYRKKNLDWNSSDEDDRRVLDSDDEELFNSTKERNINLLLNRYRCQYCNHSHFDKEKTDNHIFYCHSIPGTSKSRPRYKKSRKQGMKIIIGKDDKVRQDYVDEYKNSIVIQKDNETQHHNSDVEVNFQNNLDTMEDSFITSHYEDNSFDDLDHSDDVTETNKTENGTDHWLSCDATLPADWKFKVISDKIKHYKSPCETILKSREEIIDFMLGRGIEIYHPTGFSSITPTSIDCDGLCEGSCDFFKIFKRFYSMNDKNKFRKSAMINFITDSDVLYNINDDFIGNSRQENDVKPLTYFPAIIKGERPWIICIKGDETGLEKEAFSELKISNTFSSCKKESNHNPISNHKKITNRKRNFSGSSNNSQSLKQRKFHSDSDSRESTPINLKSRFKKRNLRSSSSSSRESTPSRNVRRKKEETKKEVIAEYEGIYVQCCRKSCKKWRLVHQYEDASNVPEYWICSMNRDKSNSICGIGGNAFSADSDKVDVKFSCGSLVWAKLKGFPWWPGMIDNCPDSDDYFWVDENISENEPTWYHVVYFEGKGTEVTRAWIKTDNIVSMTTPIRQPHGNTAKKPGPLKKRLQNAIGIAEQAKILNRKERLEKYSFEAMLDGKEKNKGKKTSNRNESYEVIRSTKEDKQNLKYCVEPRKEKRKQEISSKEEKKVKPSFLRPTFSDDSDASDSERSSKSSEHNKDVNSIRKSSIDSNSEKENSDKEDDLLSQIMKKYSREDNEEEKNKAKSADFDILEDDFSLPESGDEVTGNEASLEETLIDDYSSCYSNSDVGMSSVTIKEEKLDVENGTNTNVRVDSANSKPSLSMTELFIKPEELISSSNPHIEKHFSKPPLPSDVLVALAARNMDPDNTKGASLDEIVAFIAFNFPYYNRNIEECLTIVKKAKDNENEDEIEIDVFSIDPSEIPRLSIKIDACVKKNRSLIRESMVVPSFLDSIVEKFTNGLNCEALNYRPPYSCKMLSYLAFITLCPPVTIDQVMLFLKFLFPSLMINKTFQTSDFEELIRNDEHIQEMLTPKGRKMYLLSEGTYPTVLHQVRQFFATKSNYARLRKSIFDVDLIDSLLPNLPNELT